MDKSQFPLLDWLSENTKPIAREFFRIIEWLLMVSALSVLYKTSNNEIFRVLTLLAITVMSAYVFFGLCEWFFGNKFIEKTMNRLPVYLVGVATLLFSTLSIWLTSVISTIALSFADLAK